MLRTQPRHSVLAYAGGKVRCSVRNIIAGLVNNYYSSLSLAQKGEWYLPN